MYTPLHPHLCVPRTHLPPPVMTGGGGLKAQRGRCSEVLNQLGEVLKTAFCLWNGSAFDAEYDVLILGHRLQDFDHAGPIDYPIATGTTNWRTGHFAALGFRVFDVDVFGREHERPDL